MPLNLVNREQHFHVGIGVSSGLVMREEPKLGSNEAVELYMGLLRQIYPSQSKHHGLFIEQSLRDAVKKKKDNMFIVGAPNFMLFWLPCTECTQAGMWN